jgi:hypothetical protein
MEWSTCLACTGPYYNKHMHTRIHTYIHTYIHT